MTQNTTDNLHLDNEIRTYSLQQSNRKNRSIYQVGIAFSNFWTLSSSSIVKRVEYQRWLCVRSEVSSGTELLYTQIKKWE